MWTYKFTLIIILFLIITFSACLNTDTTVSDSSLLPTEEQNRLVEAMRQRAKAGVTITATRDILTITELDNQNRADTTYHLLNLKDNENYEDPLKKAGFNQLKFIRLSKGRKEVSNYQIGNKPMTDEPVEYID